MTYLSHLSLGYLLGVVGTILPGMLNMTIVSVRLERGAVSARNFSLGGTLAFGIHAYLALTFANYLVRHPGVFDYIRRTAVGLFLVLALYFLYRAIYPQVIKTRKAPAHIFAFGFVLALMNGLVIPYFFGLSTYFRAQGWLQLQWPFATITTAGAMIGALSVFMLYAYFADRIVSRVSFIDRNLHYLLAAFFVLLAIVQAIEIYNA